MGLASRKTKDMTVGEGFAAAADFGADVVSGIAGPIMSAGQTMVDYATGVPLEEMKRSKAYRDKELDYTPRTKLGQGLSDSGKDIVAKGAESFLGFVKDPDNAWMFGYMPEGIEAVQNLWNAIPERERMALGAGANVGEVLIGGGILSGTKSAAKLTRGDISPDVKNMPVVDTPVSSAKPALLTDNSIDAEPKQLTQQPLTANIDEIGFTSGIEEAIVKFTNSGQLKNFTAAQLLAKLKKDNSGVKKDEIEWSTFSTFLEEQGNTKMTSAEALQEARDRAITLEVIDTKTGGMEGKGWGDTPLANIEGGSNYRELKFIFNTDFKGVKPKFKDASKALGKATGKHRRLVEADDEYLDSRGTQIRRANYFNLTGQNMNHASDQYDGLRRTLEDSDTPYSAKIKDAKDDRRVLEGEWNELRKGVPRAYKSDHFPEPDIIFYTRIRDRTVGGTHSLALDEIQSDWHQGVNNKSYGYDLGPEEAAKKAKKDELRLIDEVDVLDAEKLKIEKAYDAATVSENSYWADGIRPPEDVLKENRRLFALMDDLTEKAIKADDKLVKAIEVQDVVKAGTYHEKSRVMFTPNAPMKNESKWLGAALNAMSYKAVKEGYESIAWPKGHMQVKLYPDVSAEAHTALLRTYDTTIPKLISKALKKMDKSAAIEAGEDMDFYHIKLTPKMKEVILKGQPLFLAEGGLVTGYNQGGLATDETPTMVTPARISGESPKVPTPVEGDDTAALNAAITAMRKEEAKGSEPTFYDMDDQDFPEEYGAYKTPVADTEEPPMEAAEATPSTAITQTEEALTEAATPPPVPREADRGLGIASVNTLDGGIKSIVYSVIQSEENDRGVIKDSSNWDTTTKKWLPHASAEGGADTIAYGHKFATQAEADAVTASGGITEAEAVELFKEDMGTAEARAKKEYEVKYPSHKWSSLDTLGKLMLTEVVYNIGTLKDKKGVYDWTNLSAAVRDKDFKAAKGQLSRTYRNKKGVKVSLVKRANALKAVYEKALPLTDWTK